MRAVVFEGVGKLNITDVPDPVAGPDDVVLEVAAVGICGTDVHLLDGDFEGATFPLIPGHEVSGTIVEVGKMTCGDCEFCRNGRKNLCRKWEGMGVVGNDGGSAEFMKSPATNVYKLPEGVDLYHAAFTEPLACAVRGMDLLPRIPGSDYLIYGAGTMGLMMAQLARRAGEDAGFTHTLANAGESAIDKWDVVIDCTGVVPAIEDGLTRVKPGGYFQHFGVASTDAMANYSPFRVYRDEITILGTMASLSSFDRAVPLLADGVLHAESMISHYFTLNDYSQAMDMFRAGTGRKLQIRPGAAESGVLI